MHQSLQGATFHIEHVVPKSKLGETVIDNLALACPSCNLKKADRVTIVGEDGLEVPFFNPRFHSWNEHFDWNNRSLIGKTDLGRATIQCLELNSERRKRIRMAEREFGLFPPE